MDTSIKAPAIAMNACKSSSVVAHGFCPNTGRLAIQFKNSTYHYEGVPAELYAQLQSAESVGKFFQANIRDKFKSTKLAPPKADDESEAEASA